MDLGAPHSGFVIAAYAVSAGVLVALLVGTLARDRLRRRELRKLDSDRFEERV